jgi:hypothetical protein
MGLGLDLQFYTSTSTGAGNFIAATSFTGSIANIRNFASTDYAKLVAFGRKGATAGTGRIRSALMHDDVQGLRVRALAADPTSHVPHWAPNLMYAQDSPIIDGDGTNTEVEAYVAGIYYSNLPGVAARLHMPADVLPLIDQLVAQQVTISAVAPPAIATALITANYNTLKANRDYAILGFQSDTALLAVGVQGADTGNLIAGGPCPADIFKTRDYFIRESNELSLPLVPVINAANAPATNLVVANDVVAASANVTLIMGLLRQNLSN